ncbi:hypothetical protein BC833DRAFT_528462 [Globomyces pollinis-pini]|nr:hypothetical protein BC833DRAFT_528462 [Globomyces pollinis-pini]
MICYYELLGIQRNASQNDIKKAYRKMALIHHPDKNPDRSEEATAYFAQIQEAHEVLSDERERQWYDIHREDLLRGPIDLSQKGVSEFMSTDDLLQFYSRTAFKLFDDNDNGFYSIYRALFIKIDNEEEKALQVDGDSLVDERVDRVFSFGTSNTSYDPDLIEFYNRFLTFSSVKSFRWFDEFRVMDFGDRKLRRLAEQKNKKLRDTARKQFNESVRNLASYIRKRDPRYKKYQSDILENAQRVKDEMKARLIEQQKEKEESAKNYQEQDWSKLDDSYGSDDLVDDCYNDFECVACDKVFKNERQMTTHTQSVKHLERVRLLKAEMEKDLLTMADPLNEDLDSQTFGVNELNETLDNIATEDTLAECAVCEKVFDTMQQVRTILISLV